jgi:uncharacterized Zn finger protein
MTDFPAPTQGLTVELIRAKAGDSAFVQGRRLASGGKVEIMFVTKFVIHVRVRETKFEHYELWLRATGIGLEFKCKCRRVDRGVCCKHVVAAGLFILREGLPSPEGDQVPDSGLIN